MPAMPARYMMEPQPMPFHMLHSSILSQVWSPESRNLIGALMMCRFCSSSLIMPEDENIAKAME